MRRPLVLFAGWMLLLQLIGELLGLALFFLTFDLFGDSPELMVYGLCMLPLWVLWGYLTPRKAWPGPRGALSVLLLWAMLPWGLWYLWPDHVIIWGLPQILAGTGLAMLWPGSHGSAWFLWTLEPMVQRVTFFLLPALLGLGLRQKWRKELP